MIITIAGSPFTFYPNDDELGRINLEFAAFDGEVGSGQFPVPDPAAALDPATGSQFQVEQDFALLTNGFIVDNDRDRGPFFVQSQREIPFSVQDANALLGGFRVIRNRSSETDVARVLAFAAIDGPSWDTTWVINANTVTMAAKKYSSDGGWTGELIGDVTTQTGKTLFLHDKTGGGRCLHYHLLTNGHTCGLTINDTTFNMVTSYPPMTPIRSRSSIDLRNDVMGQDQAGRTAFATDSSSIATHDADGLQHQALVPMEATSQGDLQAQVNAYLASYKNDQTTWTTTIGPLNGTALALIRVGDLITTTSSVMGLSASPQRIAHMRLSVANGNAPGLWYAELELGAPVRRRARMKYAPVIAKVVAPILPGPFVPHTNCPPSVVDDFDRSEVDSLGDASSGPTWSDDGDTRLSVNGSQAVVTTSVADASFIQPGLTLDTPVAVTPADVYVTFTTDQDLHVAPLPGLADPYQLRVVSVTVGNASGHYYRATFFTTRQPDGTSPQTHLEIAMFGGTTTDFVDQTYPSAFTFAGFILVLHMHMDGVDSYAEIAGLAMNTGTLSDPTAVPLLPLDELTMGGPSVQQPSGGTSYVPMATSWDSIEIVSDCPPSSGQQVLGEVVGTGDGSTTSFTTAYPYRPGSLQAYVNDLPEFHITETDPATGAFTFDSPPFDPEEIRVNYEAA